MITSVYGKTMENLRKRINVRLINNEKDFLNYTRKPTHITYKTFDKNYAAVHEIKPVLTLYKPTYVGFTVLELSKWLMYDFHSDFIKKTWCWIVIYWHTQSYLWNKIKIEFFKWKDLFDFSNCSKDSRFFNETNKKVIGKIKDEFGGIILSEYVALKSKMYSVKKTDGKEHNTAKVVSNWVW